jgi:hypothetical protein
VLKGGSVGRAKGIGAGVAEGIGAGVAVVTGVGEEFFAVREFVASAAQRVEAPSVSAATRRRETLERIIEWIFSPRR